MTVQEESSHSSVQIYCRSCRGTGLNRDYPVQGTGAITCRACRGSGTETITIEPFAGLRHVDGVEHVWANFINHPMVPGQIDGGMPYAEWVENPAEVHEIGREIRDKACPASWYQGVNISLMPKWAECQRVEKFHGCPLYGEKNRCWQQFDLENGR